MEFNLSDKIYENITNQPGLKIDPCIMKSDVKEFIRLLKLRIFSPIFDSSIKSKNQTEEELIAEIDKLAGKKLI